MHKSNCLDEVLCEMSGGYDLKFQSSLRLILISSLSELGLFPVKFSKTDLKEIGKIFRQKNKDAFKYGILPALNLITRASSNSSIKKYEELSFKKMKTEKEFMTELINSKLFETRYDFFSQELKEAIRKFQETNPYAPLIQKIDLDHADSEVISNFNRKSNPCNIDILNTRRKTIESFLRKQCCRFIPILNPTKQVLENVSRNKYSLISKDEFVTMSLSYLVTLVSSGKDLYEYFYSNPPTQFEFKKKSLKDRGFNNKYNKIIESILTTDEIGISIIGSMQVIRNIKDYLVSHQSKGYFKLLPSRFEDNLANETKDRSLGLSYIGPKKSIRGEIKLFTRDIFYSSMFGSSSITSHYLYKKKESQKLEKAVENCRNLDLITKALSEIGQFERKVMFR